MKILWQINNYGECGDFFSLSVFRFLKRYLKTEKIIKAKIKVLL